MSASEGELAREPVASPYELRAHWANAGQRADSIEQLSVHGIDLARLAAKEDE